MNDMAKMITLRKRIRNKKLLVLLMIILFSASFLGLFVLGMLSTGLLTSNGLVPLVIPCFGFFALGVIFIGEEVELEKELHDLQENHS